MVELWLSLDVLSFKPAWRPGQQQNSLILALTLLQSYFFWSLEFIIFESVFLEVFFLYSSFLSFQDLFLSHHWFQEFISQSLAHHLKCLSCLSSLVFSLFSCFFLILLSGIIIGFQLNFFVNHF